MSTTMEEVEQDSFESEDCYNLMSTLLPEGHITQGISQFGLNFSKKLWDGWVKQPSWENVFDSLTSVKSKKGYSPGKIAVISAIQEFVSLSQDNFDGSIDDASDYIKCEYYLKELFDADLQRRKSEVEENIDKVTLMLRLIFMLSLTLTWF